MFSVGCWKAGGRDQKYDEKGGSACTTRGKEKEGKMSVRTLAARGIAELPLIKAIKLVWTIIINYGRWLAAHTSRRRGEPRLERLASLACMTSIRKKKRERNRGGWKKEKETRHRRLWLDAEWVR